MKKLSLLAAALIVSGSAFAADPSQSSSKSLTDLVPKDEKGIAEVVHHTNQEEIRLGKLAQRKGQSDAVKQVGQMMVSDHQRADQQLLSLAKKKGWKLSDQPKGSNQTQKVMIEASKANEAKLEALDGAAFDSAYLATMVEGHDLAIMKVAMGAKQLQGSELGQMLTQLLPKLQTHRDHSYQALGEVKAKPEAMGVGGAGTMGKMNEPGGSKQPR